MSLFCSPIFDLSSLKSKNKKRILPLDRINTLTGKECLPNQKKIQKNYKIITFPESKR